MEWSAGTIEGLAPDSSSVSAARKLARPAPWSGAGHDERAVWGLCKGSGARPYQTQVDLSGHHDASRRRLHLELGHRISPCPRPALDRCSHTGISSQRGQRPPIAEDGRAIPGPQRRPGSSAAIAPRSIAHVRSA